ncbi:hypothetical protein BMS3Abin16_00974 [archaeon BMS3Abin16]|nr:hypothetical protein BMS3Abin16_00974 [archaeon BMS3Abin16]
MNTVDAIMLSQIPIAVVGILLWWEIRTIRRGIMVTENKKYTGNQKISDEDLIRLNNPLKEAPSLD